MSLSINNDYVKKAYTFTTKSTPSITTSTQQHTDDEKKIPKKKKQQIVSEKEGEYYSTYAIDENGKKILLNKIPVEQVEKKKTSQSSTKFNRTKSYDYKKVGDTIIAALKYKQNLYTENNQEKPFQELMDILKYSREF